MSNEATKLVSFKDLMQAKMEREKLEADQLVVNHELENRSTTELDVVDKITTNEKPVNNLTTKFQKSGKQKELLTTPKRVVNHKKRDWSTTEKHRSEYGAAVESFRTSEDFKRKIKVFCAEKGIDKQDFYRIVVNHYFDNVVNHVAENVVNNLTYDDRELILWKTMPLIINLYLQYNATFNEKTKWTVRDDEAGKSFNDVDIRLVELGIIQTQSNKGFSGKINSFSYYTPEIKNFIELKMPAASLDMMLEINRQRWQQQTGRILDLEFLAEKDN